MKQTAQRLHYAKNKTYACTELHNRLFPYTPCILWQNGNTNKLQFANGINVTAATENGSHVVIIFYNECITFLLTHTAF
jgi:hypothetical protein